MAKSKESARQLTDAAAAAAFAPKLDAIINTQPARVPVKGTRPDGFTGDKPGFFRGARIKR